MASSEYMIYRPEKVGCLDLVRLCLFKRRLSDCKCLENSLSQGIKVELEISNKDCPTLARTILIQKFFLLLSVAMRILGCIVEFSLNLVSVNGGLFCLIFHVITCSVVIPKPCSANYRSVIGHIDGRLDLYKASSFLSNMRWMDSINTDNDIELLDLMMMASKVAYENEAYIKNAVINHWKMHFFGFFNCWNAFLEDYGTQAYIFCDRPDDANLIVVAFRGTEPFNAKDWVTDFDLCWIRMGKMGRAHMGFMKALGLQDEKDYLKGWPKDYQGDKDKPLAYYTIRDTLKTLLEQHKNAKIVITGHSLGGALSAIFPSILILHEETAILNRLDSVLSFGQPRVGDETFGNFIEKQLRPGLQKWAYRVVYRYDVVPRVPFDSPLFEFKHFGYCIYFSNWYQGQVLEEEPNKNYFNPKYLPSEYFNAWKDLITSLRLSKIQGKDFKESGMSIFLRVMGLIIPGFGSHSPRDYLNAGRLGKITPLDKDIV